MNLTGLVEGGVNPLALFVIAFVLGGLHGLEPGHSKTMIAAYIVAVRGTIVQAVLLGLSAATSHSLIVWVVAALALTAGNELMAETAEPYFMVASGAIVLALAAWMGGRQAGVRAGGHPALALAGAAGGTLPGHTHDHHHDHGHHHHGHHHHHDHDHDHGHGDGLEADLAGGDPHARAHAMEIRQRLADGRTGTWQTILFGLTGGLIPCPAAITVLLLCLHLDNVLLGVGLVTGFSLGLGVTLVTIGVIAAWGTRFVARRSGGLFERWGGRLPYISSLLIGVVGLAMIASGLSHLSGPVVPH